METHRLVLSKFLLFLCILAISAGNLYSASLTAWKIKEATHDELVGMAALRGIEIDGVEDETLRTLLYEMEKESPPTEEEVAERAYTLKVQQAQYLMKDSGNSLVTLLGSVKASFLLAGQTDEKQLSSNKMLVDVSGTQVSAMGNVVYEDKAKDAAVQKMEGEIITLDWKSENLTVTKGMTETKRKNSDDKEISFYTTGDEIAYHTKEGGIFFTGGFITNNKENAYSSITAGKIAMMDNGDMMMQNAYLSIGRVPVLWVPYLLFPGSRMFGNPAIGYESERGWFVNSSIDVFGSYPAVSSSSSSSFSRLLESDDGKGVRILDGPAYRKLKEGESLSPLQKWASDSESYMTILADSYQNSGLSMGLSTKVNLWDKKFSAYADGNLAITPGGSDTITSYGSYPKTRYLLEAGMKLSFSFLKLDFTMPFYSDPKVKRNYANRFTAFSLDHLFGAKWPTDFSSDITSFTWKGTGSLSMPASWKSTLLDTLSISSAQFSAGYTWNRPTGETEYAYRLTSLTIPELQASVGGTIFSFDNTKKKETKEETAKEATKPEEGDKAKEKEPTLDPIVNAMLKSAYKSSISSSTTSVRRSFSLKYKVNENLSHTAKSVNNKLDWDATHYLSSITTGSLILDITPDNRFFSATQSFTPKYSFVEDRSKSQWKTKTFTLSSETTATVPFLGLSYSFAEKLYTYTETTTLDSGVDTVTTDESYFTFTTDSVTKHQISLAKAFAFGALTVQPSMTYVLPPLTQSLLPGVSLSIGNWKFSGSFKFIQEGDILKKNLITSTISYSSKLFTFSMTDSYQCASSVAGDFWHPFTSTGSLSLTEWGMTLSGSYDFTNMSSYGDHYFNSISASFGWKGCKTTLTFSGLASDLKKSSWVTKLSATAWKVEWWKKRCSLSFDLDSTLTVNFLNPNVTNLSITAGFSLSIAEFLDLKFSVTSANSSFFMYRDNNDNFSWSMMMKDLMRSFDVFGGGNRQTNFNMSKISLEMVHYMEDWTLNCKYTGSVVLSNNTYSWVPVVSVFLQWKTLPELKVDENWTVNGGVWVKSAST